MSMRCWLMVAVRFWIVLAGWLDCRVQSRWLRTLSHPRNRLPSSCASTPRNWLPSSGVERSLYIYCQSNHALNIIQNLPASISLKDILSDKAAYAEGSCHPLYDDALCQSGYSEKAQYLEHWKAEGRPKWRNQQYHITWFKPPFNKNVATNIVRRFPV